MRQHLTFAALIIGAALTTSGCVIVSDVDVPGSSGKISASCDGDRVSVAFSEHGDDINLTRLTIRGQRASGADHAVLIDGLAGFKHLSDVHIDCSREPVIRLVGKGEHGSLERAFALRGERLTPV